MWEGNRYIMMLYFYWRIENIFLSFFMELCSFSFILILILNLFKKFRIVRVILDIRIKLSGINVKDKFLDIFSFFFFSEVCLSNL